MKKITGGVTAAKGFEAAAAAAGIKYENRTDIAGSGNRQMWLYFKGRFKLVYGSAKRQQFSGTAGTGGWLSDI